ncbi:inorganic pyrophosphatase [Cichlidogyrus casuarinus]|uniref:Inorganic pyrophosphatase n=1 Tax=Cichlidogyrus casuarinus TaxID=1844966 RepID=A0ABD2QKW4_9PLAT
MRYTHSYIKLINTSSNIINLIKMSTYSVCESGKPFTKDYPTPSGPVSAFHDVPLYANQEKTHFNMVVEIPRWSNAKMEISKDDYLNPIKQDIKKDQLRFVPNLFPFHGYIWNYGAFPQTWEDPNHEDIDTKCKGDNDPLDVCEIGSAILSRGAVVKVKPLGVLAMIDEGETDWKIICINIEDPLASQLNDISDVEKEMPGFLDATRDWFKKYKIPDGKPANNFAFNGAFKGSDFALKLINETHAYWEKLMTGTVQNSISKTNVSLSNPFTSAQSDANDKLPDNRSTMEVTSSDPKSIFICMYIILFYRGQMALRLTSDIFLIISNRSQLSYLSKESNKCACNSEFFISWFNRNLDDQSKSGQLRELGSYLKNLGEVLGLEN